MLQQTQVVTVLDFYARWLVRFPDFTTLAAASEADVLHVWQGLGYYSRARNLHRAAQHVIERHGGALPDDLAAIAALPGVGRYTAGAIASFAFDRATPIIDANISGACTSSYPSFASPSTSGSKRNVTKSCLPFPCKTTFGPFS